MATSTSKVFIDIITQFTGTKSVKQAETSFDKLAKSIGRVVSVAAIEEFSRRSIKAFLADDAAAKQLEKTLTNLGIYFDSGVLSKYIQELQDTTGVLDDQLRPAFSSLAVATRDYGKAQELLNVSLDVSQGTGKSLTASQSDATGNTGISNAFNFALDTLAPTTTIAITAVNDNVGLIQGNVAAGAFTDDTTPTLSGSISAALATGDNLRIFNGTTLLGNATVNNTAKTWSFTPSTALASGFYAITARVADAAGNLATASPAQRFSIDSTANQIIGDANANTLTATTAKDVLTGLGGIDTFKFTALTSSTLANFDRITDFSIGTDILDGPTAVAAANINKFGAVTALSATSISTLLTAATFLANRDATFSSADPSGISRSFIALNDATAGYQSSADAVIEITGYIGTLGSLQVI
jgi:hypothetical protein